MPRTDRRPVRGIRSKRRATQWQADSNQAVDDGSRRQFWVEVCRFGRHRFACFCAGADFVGPNRLKEESHAFAAASHYVEGGLRVPSISQFSCFRQPQYALDNAAVKHGNIEVAPCRRAVRA